MPQDTPCCAEPITISPPYSFTKSVALEGLSATKTLNPNRMSINSSRIGAEYAKKEKVFFLSITVLRSPRPIASNAWFSSEFAVDYSAPAALRARGCSSYWIIYRLGSSLWRAFLLRQAWLKLYSVSLFAKELTYAY